MTAESKSGFGDHKTVATATSKQDK